VNWTHGSSLAQAQSRRSRLHATGDTYGFIRFSSSLTGTGKPRHCRDAQSLSRGLRPAHRQSLFPMPLLPYSGQTEDKMPISSGKRTALKRGDLRFLLFSHSLDHDQPGIPITFIGIPRYSERARISVSGNGLIFSWKTAKPPVRALRAAKHLTATLAARSLTAITADGVDLYLRGRLRQPARFETSLGYHERGRLRPSTVHQELQKLRRILNVTVVAVKGLFRPHYVTWSERSSSASEGLLPGSGPRAVAEASSERESPLRGTNTF
jgi:hypothetical protein